MEPLGSIGSIPPKAAGSSHPTASAGKTVMLLSAKLSEKLRGKQCSGCSAPMATGKEPGASPALGPASPALPWAQGLLRGGSRILPCRASTGNGAERRWGALTEVLTSFIFLITFVLSSASVADLLSSTF